MRHREGQEVALMQTYGDIIGECNDANGPGSAVRISPHARLTTSEIAPRYPWFEILSSGIKRKKMGRNNKLPSEEDVAWVGLPNSGHDWASQMVELLAGLWRKVAIDFMGLFVTLLANESYAIVLIDYVSK
ncbi:hypothetical protein NDU88_002356 [Pleurodeles waltl]|uniref:Uncharacterized protein n=1 Tax=Pleurodeles waltl TaxID=8319 RepID=A0AAV7PAL3_PLEWA|nr:hypothetical protein NDU88_002356 [Pleurodeles waltl]